MTRKLVVEAIGTFFLVLTIGLVVLGRGAGALAPFAVGFALMVMVYAGGHVSGAHYNPAVSLAVRMRRLFSTREMLGYWGAQVVAAALAAVLVPTLLPGDLEIIRGEHDVFDLLVAELLFTFALAWVVLNVATAAGTKGNSYFGIAIGLTVTTGAYAVGPISGAAFNPAVSVGLALLGIVEVGEMFTMIAVQLVGGAVAAALFEWLDLGVDKPTTATPAEQTGLRAAGDPEPRR
jgi:aquaporin Z